MNERAHNVTPAPVLARLREETRAEHDAIEAALGLMSESLTPGAYRRTLERFYGYYQPFEAAIRAVDGWAGCGLELDDRRKTPLLESDLRVLGEDRPERLPQCQQLPRIFSMADAFGGLYVMEGATLGGQHISRHVRQTLGVTPETGGRFFYGYGERTGTMWQSFRSALVAFATTRQAEDEVVASAIATFKTLRGWFQEGQTL